MSEIDLYRVKIVVVSLALKDKTDILLDWGIDQNTIALLPHHTSTTVAPLPHHTSATVAPLLH